VSVTRHLAEYLPAAAAANPFIPQIEGQPFQVSQHLSFIAEPQPSAQILLLLEHVIPPGLGTAVHEQEQPTLVQAVPSDDVGQPSLLLTLLANPLVLQEEGQVTPHRPIAVVSSIEVGQPSLLTNLLPVPFVIQIEEQPKFPATVHAGSTDVEQPSLLTTLLASVAVPFIPQEDGQPLEVLRPPAQEVIAPANILLLLEHTIPPLGIHVPEDRGSPDRFLIEVETLDTATRAQSENRSDLLLLLTIPVPPPGLGAVIREDAGSLVRHALLEQREYASTRAQVENNAPHLSLLAEHIVPPGLGPAVPTDFRTTADALVADIREIEGSSILSLLLSEVGLPPGLGSVIHEMEQPLFEVVQEGSSSLALLLAVFPPALVADTGDDAVIIIGEHVFLDDTSSQSLLLTTLPSSVVLLLQGNGQLDVPQSAIFSDREDIGGSTSLNVLLSPSLIPPELGPVVYDETEDKDRTILELYISKNPATMWNPFEKQGSNPILFLLEHTLPLLGVVGHERDETSQDWWRQERTDLLSTIWTKEREGSSINLVAPSLVKGIAVVGSFDRLRELTAEFNRTREVTGSF